VPQCGALAAYDVVYEAYGQLNAERSNAVLVCHALNASPPRRRLLRGRPAERRLVGQDMIGPGKPLDTTVLRHRVSDNTPWQHASARPVPMSVNPATGQTMYRVELSRSSPARTGWKWQARLADRLGIPAALPQSWAAASRDARRWQRTIYVSGADRERNRRRGSTPKLTAMNIALHRRSQRPTPS